jgi:hypothetical protein
VIFSFVPTLASQNFLAVSTRVAPSHDTALPGHHKADNDFSASWRGLEIQIKLFYEFERRKELVVVLQVEGSYFTTN